MNRLRNRLILVFLLATLAPLGLTLWTGLDLLKYSLSAPLPDLIASPEFVGNLPIGAVARAIFGRSSLFDSAKLS
jgi:hypothetical protein